MLGLPQNTEIRKQLPKTAVYAKFRMNTAERNKIDADISKITIVNEINPDKINIPAGDEVKSFFVMLVTLKRKDFDEHSIITLSKLIPQNMLFVLEYENQSCLAVYRNKLMKSDRKPTEEHRIELRGINLDKAWENIITAIGGFTVENDRTLDEQMLHNEKCQKLQREIDKTEKKARAERQPKKKLELARQVKALKEELDKLNSPEDKNNG